MKQTVKLSYPVRITGEENGPELNWKIQTDLSEIRWITVRRGDDKVTLSSIAVDATVEDIRNFVRWIVAILPSLQVRTGSREMALMELRESLIEAYKL